MHILRSLTVKMTIGFTVLIVLVSGLVFAYTYDSAKQALETTEAENLSRVGAVLSSQIDGDQVAALKPGDEQTPVFQAVRSKLYGLRRQDDQLKYAYIMRPASGGKAAFAVDDTYGIDPQAASIGQPYDSNDPQDTKEILAGMQGLSFSSRLYTDKWGTFLSGYAPLLNSAGKPVGVVGVDMDASTLLDRERFIGSTIYMIIGLAAAVGAALIGLFSYTLRRDLRTLRASFVALAEEKGHGLSSGSQVLRRKDEVGDLAKAVEMMEGTMRKNLRGDFSNQITRL